MITSACNRQVHATGKCTPSMTGLKSLQQAYTTGLNYDGSTECLSVLQTQFKHSASCQLCCMHHGSGMTRAPAHISTGMLL